MSLDQDRNGLEIKIRGAFIPFDPLQEDERASEIVRLFVEDAIADLLVGELEHLKVIAYLCGFERGCHVLDVSETVL